MGKQCIHLPHIEIGRYRRSAKDYSPTRDREELEAREEAAVAQGKARGDNDEIYWRGRAEREHAWESRMTSDELQRWKQWLKD